MFVLLNNGTQLGNNRMNVIQGNGELIHGDYILVTGFAYILGACVEFFTGSREGVDAICNRSELRCRSRREGLGLGLGVGTGSLDMEENSLFVYAPLNSNESESRERFNSGDSLVLGSKFAKSVPNSRLARLER